jgi:hypothetical protein
MLLSVANWLEDTLEVDAFETALSLGALAPSDADTRVGSAAATQTATDTTINLAMRMIYLPFLCPRGRIVHPGIFPVKAEFRNQRELWTAAPRADDIPHGDFHVALTIAIPAEK